MSVSHYLVSEIQVLGLLVGLIGLFYLSSSLFQKNGLHWVRPLLPATSAGLSALLWSASSVNNGRHEAVGTEAWVIAGILFVFFYLSSFLQPPEVLRRFNETKFGRRTTWVSFWGGLALLLLLSALIAIELGLTAGIYLVSPPSKVPWNHGQTPPVVFMLGGLVSGWLFWLTNLGAFHFSDDQLTRLGFVLSVAGFMTQFIPPVLDLLNITIK